MFGRACGFLCPLLAAAVAPWPAGAAVLNLTDEPIGGLLQTTMQVGAASFVGGVINGALFRRPQDADDSNAGSGIFRDLYTVDQLKATAADPQEGYNRDGAIDAAVPNGFDSVITVADLVEDSTGTAYVFVMDTNEAGNVPERYISLDDVKVFVGDESALAPLPQGLAELGGALGVPVYDMNGSGRDNHVLLDYSLYSGSGQMDLFLFVPKSAFAAATPDQQVIIYTRWGTWDGAAGFGPSAGPEQVSIPGKAVNGRVDPLVAAVPEPSAAAALLAAAGMLSRRRRR